MSRPSKVTLSFRQHYNVFDTILIDNSQYHIQFINTDNQRKNDKITNKYKYRIIIGKFFYNLKKK